jgi:hypothetical protein
MLHNSSNWMKNKTKNVLKCQQAGHCMQTIKTWTRKYRTKTRMVPIIVSTWSWHDRWWVLNHTLLQINMSVPPENSESRWCVLVALTYEHRAHLVTWENNYKYLLKHVYVSGFKMSSFNSFIKPVHVTFIVITTMWGS